MERGDETASAFASSLTSSLRLGPETRKAGQMWEKEVGSRKQESAPYNPHFGGRPGMERRGISWQRNPNTKFGRFGVLRCHFDELLRVADLHALEKRVDDGEIRHSHGYGVGEWLVSSPTSSECFPR